MRGGHRGGIMTFCIRVSTLPYSIAQHSFIQGNRELLYIKPDVFRLLRLICLEMSAPLQTHLDHARLSAPEAVMDKPAGTCMKALCFWDHIHPSINGRVTWYKPLVGSIPRRKRALSCEYSSAAHRAERHLFRDGDVPWHLCDLTNLKQCKQMIVSSGLESVKLNAG